MSLSEGVKAEIDLLKLILSSTIVAIFGLVSFLVTKFDMIGFWLTIGILVMLVVFFVAFVVIVWIYIKKIKELKGLK